MPPPTLSSLSLLPPLPPSSIEFLEPLPVESPEVLRSVAKTYPLKTATGVDGCHMRHYAYLSDGALSVLMSIYSIIEATATFSNQMR